MPSWKIHVIFNLIFLIPVILYYFRTEIFQNLILIFILIFLNILTSVIPDLDTPKSNVRKYFSFVLTFFIIIIFYLLNFEINFRTTVALIFLFLIIRFFPTKHRGVTHEFSFCVILSFIINVILWLIFRFSIFDFCFYYLVILWGFVSHIILDGITK